MKDSGTNTGVRMQEKRGEGGREKEGKADQARCAAPSFLTGFSQPAGFGSQHARVSE